MEKGTSARSLSQLASEGSAEVFAITAKENGGTDFYIHQKTDNGLYTDYSNSSDFPPAAARLIGRVREYAFPTYAIGETRLVAREGTWDEDVDGDGSFERFRFEYSQVYEGLVDLALPWDAQAKTAKFTNTYRVSVTTSKTPKQVYGYVATQQEFLAKGVGWVRVETKIEDLAGRTLEPVEIYMIKTAFVNGVRYEAPVAPAPAPSITSIQVDLTHNELVYDEVRDLYYASIPSSVVGNGNSIATIDPHTGMVSYSAAIGSEPKTMSISPGGQYLYVGLEGAGEVVKLSLPTFAVVARINLGSDSFFGTNFANSIAVSPTDPNVFAVSLKYKNVSPSHNGVILVNGTTIASKKTQSHTGSNQIAFGASSSMLYGINDETTEFGLREIAVASDGLTEGKVVATTGSFNVGNFQYKNGKIHVASSVYSAADLALLGQFKQNLSICRPLLNAAKTVCGPSVFDGTDQITVHDTSTFVTLALKASPVGGGYVRDMVPGPGGTIAISYGFSSHEPSSKVYLLGSADF
ncbi:MAG TPA: hypothetical protein VFF81_08300 [Noviherbaspirillum sp.]|nr:hypothetical protein [Noviherbaspirillum sp.]